MAELFVLGATGHVGSEVVRVALQRGHIVRALVSEPEPAARLGQLGVLVTRGDMSELPHYFDHMRQADAVIDLARARLPARVTEARTARMHAQRQRATASLLEALLALPAASRPLLFSASSVDALTPDELGLLSHRSPLAETPSGFGRIGAPMCRQLQASGVEHVPVFFGLVYGPGNAFAGRIVPGLAKGRMPIVGDGSNRLPLTSQRDAARALVHLVEQPREGVRGRRYLVCDGQPTTQRELLSHIAGRLGARRPPHIPLWLGRLALGSVMVESLTLDARVDNSALLETGFWFEHPSLREGVPIMLTQLGYTALPPGTRPPRKRPEQRPVA
jgi:nucleoside-diphosphate-sugar epimerase